MIEAKAPVSTSVLIEARRGAVDDFFRDLGRKCDDILAEEMARQQTQEAALRATALRVRRLVIGQISVWERHEQRLYESARANRPSPYSPLVDAFVCALIRGGLHGLLAPAAAAKAVA